MVAFIGQQGKTEANWEARWVPSNHLAYHIARFPPEEMIPSCIGAGHWHVTGLKYIPESNKLMRRRLLQHHTTSVQPIICWAIFFPKSIFECFCALFTAGMAAWVDTTFVISIYVIALRSFSSLPHGSANEINCTDQRRGTEVRQPCAVVKRRCDW